MSAAQLQEKRMAQSEAEETVAHEGILPLNTPWKYVIYIFIYLHAGIHGNLWNYPTFIACTVYHTTKPTVGKKTWKVTGPQNQSSLPAIGFSGAIVLGRIKLPPEVADVPCGS